MPDVDTTATGGVEFRTYRRGASATDGADQYVVPVEDKIISATWRAAISRTPGRGIAGNSPLLVVWNGNAGGSGLFVDVTHLTADLNQTVIKAVTVIPCIVRACRIGAAPTGGTTLTKVLDDTSATSSGNVTVTGDASADGTLSATALAATSTGILAQEYSSRLITAAGYESADQHKFLDAGPVVLAPQQGIMLLLAQATTTSNPATDMWVGNVRVREWTRP